MTTDSNKAPAIQQFLDGLRKQHGLGDGAGGTCAAGGEPVFFEEAASASGPGHIYSEAGLREYRITKYCEYHFDIDMMEPEEEDPALLLDGDSERPF